MTDEIKCPHCRAGQGDPDELPGLAPRPRDGEWSRSTCWRCRRDFFIEYDVTVRCKTVAHQPWGDHMEAK